MALEKRKVISALLNKGFKKTEKKAHIGFTYITSDGIKPGITTYVSHGSKSKDLNDNLIGKMARQVKLPKKSFEKLISCEIRQSEYEKLIKDKL